MQLSVLAKPPFDEFIQTCTPLLKIPALEDAMRRRVQEIVTDLLEFQPPHQKG